MRVMSTESMMSSQQTLVETVVLPESLRIRTRQERAEKRERRGNRRRQEMPPVLRAGRQDRRPK